MNRRKTDSSNRLTYQATDLPSQGVDWEGQTTMQNLGAEEDDRFQFPNPINFNLHITQLAEDFLITGRLDVEVEAVCDRCAEIFTLNIETDDVCHRYEKAIGTVIDLTDDIREDILIAFPQSCRCSDDCKGFCPKCGANLNEETCRCIQEDEEEDERNPWGALDKLKL
jgi:uncharacterized protein